jgi:hypothetical protein
MLPIAVHESASDTSRRAFARRGVIESRQAPLVTHALPNPATKPSKWLSVVLPTPS